MIDRNTGGAEVEYGLQTGGLRTGGLQTGGLRTGHLSDDPRLLKQVREQIGGKGAPAGGDESYIITRTREGLKIERVDIALPQAVVTHPWQCTTNANEVTIAPARIIYPVGSSDVIRSAYADFAGDTVTVTGTGWIIVAFDLLNELVHSETISGWGILETHNLYPSGSGTASFQPSLPSVGTGLDLDSGTVDLLLVVAEVSLDGGNAVIDKQVLKSDYYMNYQFTHAGS